MILIQYRWPHNTLTIYENGDVETKFDDGTVSRTYVNDYDEMFARDLGITGKQHKHIHELLHTMVGFRFFGQKYGSPILWRSAHGLMQPEDAVDEEKMCWQCTREVFGTHTTDKWYEDGPRKQMEKLGVNVDALVEDARRLYELPYRFGIDHITLLNPW